MPSSATALSCAENENARFCRGQRVYGALHEAVSYPDPASEGDRCY